MKRFCVFALCILSACGSDRPDTTKTISHAAQNAPYPTLLPLEGVLSQAREGSKIDAETATLQARAAFLRRKANALRNRSIVDGQDRMRALTSR